MQLLRYRYTGLYIGAIALTSYLFKEYPLIMQIDEGISFTPWTLIIGAWFVLRDFSQREIGHYVFIPMLVGVLISTFMNPALGLATFMAAVASELSDWALFTFTRRPFHQRIFISSLASAPIDTLVFFALFDWLKIIPGVSIFNWVTILLAILSKLTAALIILLIHKRRLISNPNS